ncbi:uncharacterized [Tachysurus ichikawai]
MMLTAELSSAPASCEGNKEPGLITNATAASFSCQQLDSLALSVHSWEVHYGSLFSPSDCLDCNSNALSTDCMLPNCPSSIDDAEQFSFTCFGPVSI